ncbi:MAG: hypothetical protein CL858_29545 [Cupriavidus sp.]|nr:helix-turn-helix domain-containing protein [Sphingobium sp.]MBS87182.1 hypothetical protein [Sphingobium sp.]MBU69524.1 hypothetical protein [Cupriavidus sp.]
MSGSDEPLFDPRNFARMVDSQMHRRGVRQREAADQIGVSRATLCRLLAGKAPAVETYLRVKKWIET